MKIKLINSFSLILTGLFLLACGKTSVTIDESTYEPKIVIIGYLYPNTPVRYIDITRNFPVGTTVDFSQIPLHDADVRITDVETNSVYPLSYDDLSRTFSYPPDDLIIDYGKSYRLDVRAEIDGSVLQASSTTIIPDAGLKIDLDNSIYGDLYYRQTDDNGTLISPRVAYTQSENTAFYLLSISGLEASKETFIYENPFNFDIQEALDDGAKIEDFQYRARWTRPENQVGEFSLIEISWFQIWFYGSYRLLLYAGDQNFYHFYSTHRNVQEVDGNLHEPLFDIDGDGIGVFGSAVVDTIYLNVLKK